MQRLSSIARNKENSPGAQEREAASPMQSERSDACLEITHDILFLISNFTNKLTGDRRKPDSSLDLQILTPHVFSHDFGLNKNLRNVSIRNSCLVKLRCFEGLKISRLEFEKASVFEFDRLEDVNVSHLVLKDISTDFETLSKLLCSLSPRSLDLVNVQLTGPRHPRCAAALYSEILRSRICSLGVENSFMPADRFFEIVQKKDMKKFYYRSLNSMVKYRALGQSFSYFAVREMDLSGFFDLSWLSVDVLSTDCNNAVLDNIWHAGSRVRFQWLENCKINASTIKKLPKLSSLYINRCVFEGMGFYELINSQKHSLRYISVENTDLPFDGAHYILQSTKDCRVVLNSIIMRE